MPPLRKILIMLVAADIILGTVAYLVVFYDTPGTYEIANSPLPTTSVFSSTSTIALPTSTASSTISSSTAGGAVGGGSSSNGGGNSSNGSYASDFGLPYPISWTEGDASISVMGAMLQGNQFTLNLAVAVGNTMQCIPLNVRMLVDEQGDLAAPETTQFAFPETGSCQGAPGATYTDQQVIFDVDPTALPFYFTTGGASNIFFEIATTTSGGLSVSIPQKSG